MVQGQSRSNNQLVPPAFIKSMDVYEAVTSRRVVRGFTDLPIQKEVLERVLSAAAWSPFGSKVNRIEFYKITFSIK